MGRRRATYFLFEDMCLFIDFGSYALAMYYAKQLNREKGKKLFDATISEYWYRCYYDLPRDNYTSENDEAHFVITDLEEVIAFMDNELLPALNDESEDIINQYGGLDNFIELFYSNTNGTYLEEIGLYHHEYYESDGPALAFELEKIKDLFSHCLSLKEPYRVYTY